MKQIESYTPVKQEEGILLNANECSTQLSKEIRTEIKNAMDSILFNRYPDPDETKLLEAYSKVVDIPSSCLLAGNGSDQMLGYLIGTYLGKGKTLVTLNPDFSMYDYYVGTYEGEVCKYPQDENGLWDVQGVIELALAKKANMVMFSNPNNPSGTMISQDKIVELVTALKDIPVVVDEAYVEFSDAESCAPLTKKYENLFVTRTLSKAYGLAGLRVGFLIGNENVMKQLKQAFVPYALNSVSMEIATIVLQHMDEVNAYIDLVKQERKELYAYASTLKKAKFYPSQGNFLKGRSAEKDRLLALLKEENVIIRNYDGTDTFRITIGTKEENEIVRKVLKKFEEE